MTTATAPTAATHPRGPSQASTGPHTDPTSERRVPVRLIAYLFPVGRYGKDRRPETIARYIQRGIQVGDQVIKLEGGVDTDGRRWWTTAAAVERFLRQLTAAKVGAGERLPVPAAPRSGQASRASAEFQRLRDKARPGRRKA